VLIKIHEKELNEELTRKPLIENESVKDFSVNFFPGEVQIHGRFKKAIVSLKLLVRLEVINFAFDHESRRVTFKINELKPSILASDLLLGKLVSSRVPYLEYDAARKVIELNLSEHKSIKKREKELAEVVLNKFSLERGVMLFDVDGIKDVDSLVKNRAYIEVIA
jgi:hypothetical protein